MFVSHSICWVSRVTILTGLTGRGYGVYGQRDTAKPEAVKELYSDILKKQGYNTAYFGKWNAKMPKGWKMQEHFDRIEPVGRNPFYKKMPDGSLRHETEVIVDKGISFMKEQSKDKPFYVTMSFNACHAEDGDRRPGVGHFPWPRAVDGMYDDITIPKAKLDTKEILDSQPNFLKTTINRERYFWRWNTAEKYQENIRSYYRMVTGIDQAMGRFLKALDEAGLADNTIVVYSADNGYHLANRGLAGKWSHYEESLRVPLVVYDPRPTAKKGQVIQGSALNLDLPATFVDWAGAKVPTRYQGRSLKGAVDGGDPKDWREETFHEHFAVRGRIPAFEGLRGERYKYVRYIDNNSTEYLHDLKNDPDELVNLAKSPEHAEVLKGFRERTDKRVKELGGPLKAAKPAGPSTVPHPVAGAMVSSRKGDADGFIKIPTDNLRGWSGDPKIWSGKKGVLTGKTDGSIKYNRFITWKHSTIVNFDLRLKVKISPGGNSGVQYRSRMMPKIGLDAVGGYQCDIVAGHGKYNGMAYEERGRGILGDAGQKVVVDETGKKNVVGKMEVKTFPADEWHEYRILAEGNHIRHWINGHQTADLIDHHVEGRRQIGVLGFQAHVGKPMTVEFKDIRIKHLPDNLPLKGK
jgi:arylsulfatase A-like enzyme